LAPVIASLTATGTSRFKDFVSELKLMKENNHAPDINFDRIVRVFVGQTYCAGKCSQLFDPRIDLERS
jgi:hypothetical protein